MSTAVRHTPAFSASEAAELAERHFGISAEATPLAGDRDQNFRLDVSGVPAFVLKIANPVEERAAIEGQHRLLAWLHERTPPLGVPRAVPALNGQEVTTGANRAGVIHLIRVLTYVPGIAVAELPPPRSSALLESLGAFLAALTAALEGFDDPAAHRRFEWDLLHGCDTVRHKARLLDGAARREVVETVVSRFGGRVQPRLEAMRRSVIQNDGNDHNLLVTGGVVSGIIDFGDMVYSLTAAELAVGAAYAMLDEPDPMAAARSVVRGFETVFPLADAEQDVLFDLMLMRLAISVSVCAEQKQLQPDNAYLTVSERPAWAALEQLSALDPRTAREWLFPPADGS